MDFKNLKNKILEALKLIGGHAVTGFMTGALVSLGQMNPTNINNMLTGALIGGAIGALKELLNLVEQYQPKTDAKLAKTAKLKIETENKKVRTYLGL